MKAFHRRACSQADRAGVSPPGQIRHGIARAHIPAIKDQPDCAERVSEGVHRRKCHFSRGRQWSSRSHCPLAANALTTWTLTTSSRSASPTCSARPWPTNEGQICSDLLCRNRPSRALAPTNASTNRQRSTRNRTNLSSSTRTRRRRLQPVRVGQRRRKVGSRSATSARTAQTRTRTIWTRTGKAESLHRGRMRITTPRRTKTAGSCQFAFNSPRGSRTV